MTFSIVARCPRTGQVGVGALTAMVGVGKLVSHAWAGVGAVGSQATMNPYYGFDGLRLMADGVPAPEALRRVVEADPARSLRQCGMVDAEGGADAWTGEGTEDWSGHLVGDGWAVQGNRLVGPETLEATAGEFLAHPERELAERLLLALEAGEATGADRKGEQSGVIYVMDTEEYPLWDVRIDHADDPAAALRALVDEFASQLIPQVRGLPTREDPVGELARELLPDVDG